MSGQTIDDEICDLCDRPIGEGKGQCRYIGSRGCKIVQGRLQLKAIRDGAKAFDKRSATPGKQGKQGR